MDSLAKYGGLDKNRKRHCSCKQGFTHEQISFQLEDDQRHGHCHAGPLHPLCHRYAWLQLPVVRVPGVGPSPTFQVASRNKSYQHFWGCLCHHEFGIIFLRYGRGMVQDDTV